MGTGEDTEADAPAIEEGSFTSVTGGRIHWQSWSPAGDQRVRAAVVLAHGYGEHLGRYEYVARSLVFAGYAVYALDHHGHGRSEGPRGQIMFAEAVADVDQLVSITAERAPNRPIFLLGHSLGGAIALRYALAHQDRLAGMVLSGPLAAIDGGPVLAAIGRALGVIAPWLPVSKIDPKWISREPAVVARYITDTLVLHRAIRAEVARDFLLHVQTLPAAVGAIRLPTLLMYGTADRLCPPRGSVMLADRLGSEDLTTRAYEGLYHEILNEPERDHVLTDLEEWLDARSADTRSRAS